MQSGDQYAGLVSPSLHPDDAGVHQRRTTFPLKTDPLQDDKATEIKLLSVARPHMRAFHYAWLSFFFAFFGWFSIPPLMPTIKKQLGLTADQVSNSNIVSVASTILGRAIGGPMCDRYGSRTVQAVLLVVGAIPVASASLVTSYTGLMFARFFIGLVGCSFIATTYWTSTMFSKEVVGSANALAAGWGNLGAGATTLITPQLFNLVTSGGALSDNMGWRVSLLFPALFMVITGIALYFNSDDCPQGQYKDLRKIDTRHETRSSTRRQTPVTWILAFHYACSFGVELQVHNVLTEFYYEDFTYSNCDPKTDVNECRRLTQSRATLISSLFGLMCIFARALGGYLSDIGNRRCGMKGRIAVQFVAFAGQAVFLYLYSTTKNLSSSIPLLVFFGIFVQACTGSTYGIVPYVLPTFTGATSGFVGAGGNVGALCWSLMFKGIGNRATSFKYLSIFVAAAALTTFGIKVPGNAALWEKDDSVHGGLAPTEMDDDSVHNGKVAA
ncbi:High affinity nitrate transporter 2.5 [Phytophthora citrophthora]|uniref:High affinity nitrate transporter 2.5 n=1 Tax=Phytophthora citrophthora TaxID=4793 RepID=A0AAD9LTV9_9STRA|nr:High affinity nitrate transporter 2.5 [Phytophthora citrophthora]